jgi:hypothetical protein
MARCAQLQPHRLDESARQHHDAILVALCLAHDDGVALEIDILHAKALRLHQPHARAVEQVGDEPDFSRDGCKQGCHLVAREHRRQPTRPCGPREISEPRQIDTQHFAIEKKQRAERLVVRGGGHAPLRGKHGEKRFDLVRTHVARMLHAAPADEKADPVDVRLFGREAVVQIPRAFAHLAEQADGAGRNGGCALRVVCAAGKRAGVH